MNTMITDKKIVITIGVVLVVGVLGFLGGMQYQKRKLPAGVAFNQNQMRGIGGFNGQRTLGTGGMMRGGSGVIGEVLSKDDKSITVKLQDGGSKIVFFSGTTTIAKSAQGTIGDVTTGTQVVVTGTTNPDGSVTAQNIQLRPAPQPGTVQR